MLWWGTGLGRAAAWTVPSGKLTHLWCQLGVMDNLRDLILLFRHTLSNFEFSAHTDASILFLKNFPCSLLNLKPIGTLGKVTRLHCCQKIRPECTEGAENHSSSSNSGTARRKNTPCDGALGKKSHRSVFQVYELNAENKCAHLRFLHGQASRCVCARRSASGRSLGLRFSLQTGCLKPCRGWPQMVFQAETVFRRASPAEPSWEFNCSMTAKKNPITPSLKYQTAAGERNDPLTHTCTVYLHNCCKTAFFPMIHHQETSCILLGGKFSLSRGQRLLILPVNGWKQRLVWLRFSPGNRCKFYCSNLIYAKHKVPCVYTIVNKKNVAVV